MHFLLSLNFRRTSKTLTVPRRIEEVVRPTQLVFCQLLEFAIGKSFSAHNFAISFNSTSVLKITKIYKWRRFSLECSRTHLAGDIHRSCFSSLETFCASVAVAHTNDNKQSFKYRSLESHLQHTLVPPSSMPFPLLYVFSNYTVLLPPSPRASPAPYHFGYKYVGFF